MMEREMDEQLNKEIRAAIGDLVIQNVSLSLELRKLKAVLAAEPPAQPAAQAGAFSGKAESGFPSKHAADAGVLAPASEPAQAG
jgi:regulator of replication initiation timing